MPAQLPLYWFWLPVLDCARLMVARIYNGRSPFSADRNHFHHLLLEKVGTRFALPCYLGLLAAPGVAAEFDGMIASTVLLTCMACYALYLQMTRTPAASVPA